MFCRLELNPILCHPPFLPSVLPSIRVFTMSQFFTSGGQSIGASASASVLPVNIQDGFPLGLTGWISLQSKGFSKVFSNKQFKRINSSGLSFLYSPILTSIHDYWKNHSFDQMDLCWQSNVSAFQYAIIALISHASKVTLKILQARLQQYVTVNFHKLVLEKSEEPQIKLPTSSGLSKKQQNTRKTKHLFLLY